MLKRFALFLMSTMAVLPSVARAQVPGSDFTPPSDAFDSGNFLNVDWAALLTTSTTTGVSNWDTGWLDVFHYNDGTTIAGSDGRNDIRIQFLEQRADFPNSASGGDRLHSTYDASQGPSGSGNGALQINDQVAGGAAFGSRNHQELIVTFGDGIVVEAADLGFFHSSLNSAGDRHEWTTIELQSDATANWSAPDPTTFLNDLYETTAGNGMSNGSLTPGVGGPGGENNDINGWFFATDDNTDSGSSQGLSIGGGGTFDYVGSTSPGAEAGSDGSFNSGSFTGNETGLAATQIVYGFRYRQYVDEVDEYTGDGPGRYVTRFDFGLTNIQAVPEPSGLAVLGLSSLIALARRRRA